MTHLCWRMATLGFVFITGSLRGQGTPASPVPCVNTTCGAEFNWGNGKTAGDYSADRRYGAGGDFEAALLRTLTMRGAQLREASAAAYKVVVRLRIDARAMCDAMAGTGTSYGCKAISNASVSFASADSTRPPATINIANRCSDQSYLTMKAFGEYAADMIWWTLTQAQTRERKPSSRC